MDRRSIVVKVALLAACVALLPTQPAQACVYGYYYYPGYGCRPYDYGFPARVIGGLVFGILAHHHHHAYSGYDGHGGIPDGFAGAFAHREPGRAIARAPGHPGAVPLLGAGFGSSVPPLTRRRMPPRRRRRPAANTSTDPARPGARARGLIQVNRRDAGTLYGIGDASGRSARTLAA